MKLSLVIPVYNGEQFIAANLNQLRLYLERYYSGEFEIILVNDGSSDQTAATLEPFKSQSIEVINLPQNRGKFAALKAGMAQARGQCAIFTDADLPFEFEALRYIERQVNTRDLHIVIGDRNIAGSEYSDLPLLRRIATLAFSLMVRMLVTGGLFDTQCGLKGLRRDVAQALFPLITADGFSGDVELLYIALKYNLEIKRIPVRLRRSAPSTVRVLTHGVRMLRKISLLKIHWLRGRYQSERLREIAKQDYWDLTPSPHNSDIP